MPSPDGWTEGEGDLPFLPKQDGFDGVRRFFDDLLRPLEESDHQHRQAWGGNIEWTTPPLRFLCTACDGDGRIAHRDEAENLWNMSCPVCDGTGSMTVVPERKGTR